jgi:hypothetical protein
VVVHVIVVPADHSSVSVAVRTHFLWFDRLTIVLGNPPCTGSRSAFAAFSTRGRGRVLLPPF